MARKIVGGEDLINFAEVRRECRETFGIVPLEIAQEAHGKSQTHRLSPHWLNATAPARKCRITPQFSGRARR